MSDRIITSRVLTLFSEGTRLAAEIYSPATDAPAKGHPALLLCHGWGGLKSGLVKYAEAFARAGFVAMIFDYRGWGESDGRIIARADSPRLVEAGERTLEVTVLREIVDPVDQTTDVRNCLALLSTEPGVDPSRIGIWGSSYGGGHAVFTAGHDNRIRAVVAQIGGYTFLPKYRDAARARAAEKARGAIDPVVPQGGLDAAPGLKGTPDIARMGVHSALAAAANIRVPTLIIDAENEELMNRLEHGFIVFNVVRQNTICEYRTFPCRHYDVYDRYYSESVALALDWFRAYLSTNLEA
jgi:dienelactone hydrolase